MTNIDRTSLAYYPGVAFILIEVRCNILPKLLEDKGTSSEVKRGKVRMFDSLSDDFRRRSRNELDDACWQTGFLEYLLDDIVGIGCCRRRFPENDIAQHGGC